MSRSKRRNSSRRKNKQKTPSSAAQTPTSSQATPTTTETEIADAFAATLDAPESTVAAQPAADADKMGRSLEKVESLLTKIDQNDGPNRDESTTVTHDIVNQLSERFEQTIQGVNEKWQQQVDQLTNSFEQRLETSLASLAKNIADEIRDSLPQDAASHSSHTSSDDSDSTSTDLIVLEKNRQASAATPADADTPSPWEIKKKELYAQMGEEYDIGSTKDESSPRSTKANDKPDELESLHDSIDSIEAVEAEEIEELRARLTEKLREAEVELSINRAKLDQRTASLEIRQFEIERREKTLAKKYSAIDGSVQKSSILDRLTQHLKLRKPKNDLMD